jgi:hypothetical protein
MGKPVVLPERVPQVRYGFDFWHTATHAVVSWVLAGLL